MGLGWLLVTHVAYANTLVWPTALRIPVGLGKKAGWSVDWKAAGAYMLYWEQLPVCHVETYGLSSASLENHRDHSSFNHLALLFPKYLTWPYPFSFTEPTCPPLPNLWLKQIQPSAFALVLLFVINQILIILIHESDTLERWNKYTQMQGILFLLFNIIFLSTLAM
jgi:hypothetical protein